MANWSASALESTVYSFGHHGSNHSNTPAFLKAVNPRIGIFSASAAHMGYGHPRCVLVDYVEKLVDKDGRNGISIAMHRIDCFKDRQYVTEENNLGVFLTATQGNIKFSGDPADYSIIVDRLR
jgi:beta-lactamase superfamily II metal-dependent hydrolase